MTACFSFRTVLFLKRAKFMHISIFKILFIQKVSSSAQRNNSLQEVHIYASAGNSIYSNSICQSKLLFVRQFQVLKLKVQVSSRIGYITFVRKFDVILDPLVLSCTNINFRFQSSYIQTLTFLLCMKIFLKMDKYVLCVVRNTM